MNKRRSERLRRKHDPTPGLSQPGAYSVYNDGLVVESEASFLPPPAGATATPTAAKPPLTPSSARRARYASSPHRFTDESPVSTDKAPREDAAERPIITAQVDVTEADAAQASAGATQRSDDTLPATASDEPEQLSTPSDKVIARRDLLVDLVRTSLFDVLGSNTRKPVNPRWRPAATPASKPNNPNNPNRLRRRPNGNATPPPFSGSLPERPRTQTRVPDPDDDTIASDDEDEEDENDRDATPGPAQTARRILRRLTSPLTIMLLIVAVSFAVVFALEARTARKRGVPTAASRMLGPVAAALSAVRLSAWGALSVPQFELPADVLTRKDLTEVVLPQLLDAARAEAARAAGSAVEQGQARIREATDRAAELVQNAEKRVADSAATLESLQNAAERKDEDKDANYAEFAERFSADKGLPPDFALESAGGAILDSNPAPLVMWVRFAREYAAALVSQRRFTPTRPRLAAAVLSPDVLPGNCWVFDGSTGHVTIRLARPIHVTAISLEHTPRTSAFSIASAPRNLRVVGLPINPEDDDVPLANYLTFDLFAPGASHLQTFDVDKIGGNIVMRAVRLYIDSNHGANFTAVYRIRVHGDEQILPEDGGEL